MKMGAEGLSETYVTMTKRQGVILQNTHNTELIVNIVVFHGLRFVSHSDGWNESLRLKPISTRQYRDLRSQLVYLVLYTTFRCVCRNSFLLAKPCL